MDLILKLLIDLEILPEEALIGRQKFLDLPYLHRTALATPISYLMEYEDAIKRDPSSAPLRNNLAAALVKIMDFNGAKTQVEKSLELDPTYVKAWAKKGDVEFFMKEYHKALESYKKGLSLDEGSTLCKDGLRKTMAKINEANAQGPDAERQAHAMADPEIQMILQDMTIRQVLQDFQENPQHAQMVYQKDANVRAKIDKPFAEELIRTRRGEGYVFGR